MDVSPALSAGGGKPGSGYSAVLANPLGAHHPRQDLANKTYVASAVSASAGHHGHSSPRGDGSDTLWVQETAYALAARNAKGVSLLESQDNFAASPQCVRRLTPLECERLQGWPDDHTRYGDDGREIPDSQRYKIIGNGVASPVAEWIGRRLVAVAAAEGAG